jgi:ABC-type Fe3+/spermidine/putrescine transport system ATPase subunit
MKRVTILRFRLAAQTTIVNLVSRFYDPTSGCVRLGGVDLRELDPVALRERIGVLLQDFARFQLTVREHRRPGDGSRAPRRASRSRNAPNVSTNSSGEQVAEDENALARQCVCEARCDRLAARTFGRRHLESDVEVDGVLVARLHRW